MPKMDWNSNTNSSNFFITPHSQSSFTTFLCNSNFPFTEMMVPPQETISESSMMMMTNYNGSNQEKKRRLTAVQLELLESSFQEEIKLDPERKIKLAGEVGLEPRQVAVWFQNRRARWRTKKLQHLYHLLKQDYDVVTKEKHKLHQEVLKLRSMLMDQQAHTQSSMKYNIEGSNDQETVESIQRRKVNGVRVQEQEQSKFNTLRISPIRVQTAARSEGELLNIVQDYNINDIDVLPSYWPPFPSSYPSK